GLSTTACARRGVGWARLSESEREPLAAWRATWSARGQVSSVAHAGSAARTSNRVRRESELEAHLPELQRVPALPEPAPGSQQAVPLLVRRERTAARDLHGRSDGPATGHRDVVDGRHLSSRVFAWAFGRGQAAGLLLLHLSELDAQPAPRL